MKGGTLVLLLLFLLAFILGLVVAAQEPSSQYRSAMEQLKLSTATRMAFLKVIFWHSLAGIALLGLALSLGVILWSMWQRSQLIHPDDSGLFPVVRGRVGGQAYYHDPNRQLPGSVAYRPGPESVELQPLLPAGAEEAQLQVTTQAQVAQVVAASSQGKGMARTTRRLVERMTQTRPVPRLPEVEVVEGNIAEPEARHLLEAIRQDWRKE